MGSNENHTLSPQNKAFIHKIRRKKSWTLKVLMGERCQDLKRTIFQLERECTSSRTIGIRFEFILTTAQCITVLSVAKLLYQSVIVQIIEDSCRDGPCGVLIGVEDLQINIRLA